MDEGHSLQDFYTDLIRVSQEAFEQEFYEIAFHSLSAAMHAAEALNDLLRLEQVHSIALHQSQ